MRASMSRVNLLEDACRCKVSVAKAGSVLCQFCLGNLNSMSNFMPTEFVKGVEVRCPATGIRGVVRKINYYKNLLLVIDTCGTPKWVDAESWDVLENQGK